MKKTIFFSTMVALFMVAAGAQAQTVCTMDAMQCPDGSWVGRSGPSCEFVCPGQGGGSSGSQGGGAGTAKPTYPTPSVPVGEAPDRPVNDRDPVGSTHSNGGQVNIDPRSGMEPGVAQDLNATLDEERMEMDSRRGFWHRVTAFFDSLRSWFSW